MIGFRATGPGLLFALLTTSVPQVASLPKGSAEEKLLGAPCRGRSQRSPQTRAARQAIYRKLRTAVKQSDFPAAVAIRKELIRYRCHSHFLWFSLAELYVESDQNDDAIAVLDYLYEKKNNEVDRRLHTEGNALHPLAQSHEFQRSALAGKLSQARALLEERKQQYRKKLEALPPGGKPPRDYVAKDACPFECCTFQIWDVYADTALYEAEGREGGCACREGREGRGTNWRGPYPAHGGRRAAFASLLECVNRGDRFPPRLSGRRDQARVG